LSILLRKTKDVGPVEVLLDPKESPARRKLYPLEGVRVNSKYALVPVRAPPVAVNPILQPPEAPA
jgi:hypothetical protein